MVLHITCCDLYLQSSQSKPTVLGTVNSECKILSTGAANESIRCSNTWAVQLVWKAHLCSAQESSQETGVKTGIWQRRQVEALLPRFPFQTSYLEPNQTSPQTLECRLCTFESLLCANKSWFTVCVFVKSFVYLYIHFMLEKQIHFPSPRVAKHTVGANCNMAPTLARWIVLAFVAVCVGGQ